MRSVVLRATQCCRSAHKDASANFFSLLTQLDCAIWEPCAALVYTTERSNVMHSACVGRVARVLQNGMEGVSSDANTADPVLFRRALDSLRLGADLPVSTTIYAAKLSRARVPCQTSGTQSRKGFSRTARRTCLPTRYDAQLHTFGNYSTDWILCRRLMALRSGW